MRYTSILLLGILGILGCGGETSSSAPSAPTAAPTAAPVPAAAPTVAWHPVKFCDIIAERSVCFDSDQATLSDADCVTAVNRKAKAQDGACPPEARVGSCKLPEGGMLHLYSTGGDAFQARRAENTCTDSKGGTPVSL